MSKSRADASDTRMVFTQQASEVAFRTRPGTFLACITARPFASKSVVFHIGYDVMAHADSALFVGLTSVKDFHPEGNIHGNGTLFIACRTGHAHLPSSAGRTGSSHAMHSRVIDVNSTIRLTRNESAADRDHFDIDVTVSDVYNHASSYPRVFRGLSRGVLLFGFVSGMGHTSRVHATFTS